MGFDHIIQDSGQGVQHKEQKWKKTEREKDRSQQTLALHNHQIE